MDRLVTGGGSAGLTAAIHLTRFRRHFLVIDAAASRASWIPVSHHLAGYPDGIAGTDILASMRAQADRYGSEIIHGGVERLERPAGGGFVAIMADGSRYEAKRALLASGTEDVPPPLALHEQPWPLRRPGRPGSSVSACAATAPAAPACEQLTPPPATVCSHPLSYSSLNR